MAAGPDVLDERQWYRSWNEDRRENDRIFSDAISQKAHEEAMGAAFVPFEKLDDSEFMYEQRSDLTEAQQKFGMLRYVPYLKEKEALQAYPRCLETGLLYPFVYFHVGVQCTKNGSLKTTFGYKDMKRLITGEKLRLSCHKCTATQDACDLQVGVKVFKQRGTKYGDKQQYETMNAALAFRRTQLETILGVNLNAALDLGIEDNDTMSVHRRHVGLPTEMATVLDAVKACPSAATVHNALVALVKFSYILSPHTAPKGSQAPPIESTATIGFTPEKSFAPGPIGVSNVMQWSYEQYLQSSPSNVCGPPHELMSTATNLLSSCFAGPDAENESDGLPTEVSTPTPEQLLAVLETPRDATEVCHPPEAVSSPPTDPSVVNVDDKPSLDESWQDVFEFAQIATSDTGLALQPSAASPGGATDAGDDVASVPSIAVGVGRFTPFADQAAKGVPEVTANAPYEQDPCFTTPIPPFAGESDAIAANLLPAETAEPHSKQADAEFPTSEAPTASSNVGTTAEEGIMNASEEDGVRQTKSKRMLEPEQEEMQLLEGEEMRAKKRKLNVDLNAAEKLYLAGTRRAMNRST